MHSLTPPDSGLFTDAPLLAALSRLRAEGVIIGLSASGPHQAEAIRRALALTVDGQQLFTAAQVTWNLLEPSSGPRRGRSRRGRVGGPGQGGGRERAADRGGRQPPGAR